MHQLIILDRDGVINYDADDYIKNPDEFRPIESVLEAMARLSQGGWTIVVATNQSGIARGLLTVHMLADIHKKMHTLLKRQGGRIDAIFFCPHTSEAGCNCRKPKPGLFQDIAKRYRTSLAKVPNVGDSPRDLQAGAHMGCRSFFVETGKKLANPGELPPGTEIFPHLTAVVDTLLHQGH